MMKTWAYEVDSQLLASQQTDLQLSFMMIIHFYVGMKDSPALSHIELFPS